MTINITRGGLQILFFGCSLFLIGLLQGGVLSEFTNPKMALSAHLAAVQSGIALMVFGTFWCLVRLNSFYESIARISGISGMYLVWLAITAAALNGASNVLPIAGAGYHSSQVGEWFVATTIYFGAGLVISAVVLITFGLYRNFHDVEPVSKSV